MDATADVARTAGPLRPATPRRDESHAQLRPARTTGESLTRALVEYPATLLWEELRRQLPAESASRVFDVAIQASLES
jgi:hypothetical protein